MELVLVKEQSGEYDMNRILVRGRVAIFVITDTKMSIITN